MENEYKKLIKLIELSNITLVESHEKLFFAPKEDQLSSVRIDTEHGYSKDDPVITDTELLNNHKYKFTFSVENKKYYVAEYILFVSFSTKDKDEVIRLLGIEEIKNLFIEKQINKLIWSYLRGIVMDSFNRHSLKPIPLPLMG